MFIGRSEFIIKIPPCGNPVGLFVCLFACVRVYDLFAHVNACVPCVCLLFSQPPCNVPSTNTHISPLPLEKLQP